MTQFSSCRKQDTTGNLLKSGKQDEYKVTGITRMTGIPRVTMVTGITMNGLTGMTRMIGMIWMTKDD